MVEVKPVQEDPNKLTQGTRGRYTGEKLSLNFQNVEVRAVLNVIADFTDLNIITSDTVAGNLTLRLKDVPWDQALDIILQTRASTCARTATWSDRAARGARAEGEAALENALQITQLEPLRSESFQLNYMKASDLQNLISSNRQQHFGAGGRADGDDRRPGLDPVQARRRDGRPAHEHPLRAGHGVAARGSPPDHPADRHPRAPGADRGAHRDRQRHVRPAARRALRPADRLHVRQRRYCGGLERQRSNTQPVVTPLGGNDVSRETRTQTPFELASGHRVRRYSDSPQLNSTCRPSAAGQLALTLINLGSGNLINLELSALEADNRGKVVSSPRVVTADNQKAAIEQGTEIPYVTPGSANSPATVAFKKAVLRLEVTPRITPDDRIIMDVEVSKDSVGQFVAARRRLRAVDRHQERVTQISVNNGDTAVIGGIFEETIRNDVDKVPFLGDIPCSATCSSRRAARRKDRAADLPDAAHRQGNGNLRAVSADDSASGAVAAPDLLHAPVPLHRGNLFLVGLPGAGKSTLGASSRAGCSKHFVDADHELEGGSACRFRRSSRSRARRDFATARRPCSPSSRSSRDIVLSTGGGVVLRAGQPRAPQGKRHRGLPAPSPRRCGSASATAATGRCCRPADPRGTPGDSMRSATRSTARSPTMCRVGARAR